MRRISSISRSDRISGSDDGAVILRGGKRHVGRGDPPSPSSVVVDTHFRPFIYGPFLNRVCMVGGLVAAKAESGPPCALTLGFITGETHPTARWLLDRPFTDPTPSAEETDVATRATERLARVADRRRQLCATLRVAAALPQILSGGGPVPDCVLKGVVGADKGQSGCLFAWCGSETKMKGALCRGRLSPFRCSQCSDDLRARVCACAASAP